MAIKNNIFEDFAKVSTNLASGLFESGKNVSEGIKAKTQSFAKAADLVTRDEFEVVRSMAGRIRLENETLLKDMAELKKQMQTIVSSLDVIKNQAPKGGSEDGQKIISQLKNFGEEVDNKLMEFGNIVKSQQDEIEKINSVLEKQPSEKAPKAVKIKKSEIQTPSLFDDEQN